jgi:hypothetical protein
MAKSGIALTGLFLATLALSDLNLCTFAGCRSLGFPLTKAVLVRVGYTEDITKDTIDNLSTGAKAYKEHCGNNK